MLKAITSGKSGRIPDGVKPGDPWSSAIRQREDLLTGSVFGRLAYLEPEILWSILRMTFGHSLSDFKVVKLENIAFWPRWPDPCTGGTVEPDIFAEFVVGDPSKRIAIIFEAKLGQNQDAKQWQRQWNAYQSLLIAGEADADEVLLLAIGGFVGHGTLFASQFKTAIHTETSGKISINAAAADWRRLADAVFVHHKSAVGADSRILADIAEALALFGFRHVHSIASLSELPIPQDSVSALKTLQNWRLENV